MPDRLGEIERWLALPDLVALRERPPLSVESPMMLLQQSLVVNDHLRRRVKAAEAIVEWTTPRSFGDEYWGLMETWQRIVVEAP